MASPNQLFYGDNLDILRHHIADESVDLIYLDPPFNSNRNYNVLFREKSGESSPAQIQAFTDTWAWDRAAEAAFEELIPRELLGLVRMLTRPSGTSTIQRSERRQSAAMPASRHCIV